MAKETKDGKKHPSYKRKSRYWHLELQCSHIQVTKHEDKNTVNNSQGNMFPTETGNPTTIDSEKGNITETQDKDLRTVFMDIIEIHKNDVNKSIKENYENPNNGRQ